MSKRWLLTQDNFDRLLAWLHPDREEAGRRYEDIRYSLIKFFTWRGMSDAEGLADETINRVARKVTEVAAGYTGEPALYFYGVAKKIMMEYRRQQPAAELDESIVSPALDESKTLERRFKCLEQCLQTLSPTDRRIILDYYKKAKQTKIDFRKELAQKYGIESNALRVRVHRIRTRIHKCVITCLQITDANVSE